MAQQPISSTLLVVLTCVAVFSHLVNAVTSTNGCHLPIPTEITPGGESYNFTHFLSNSTSPPSYRAYSLTVPPDYPIEIPAPLILSFHGRGKTNLEQEQLSKFSNPFFNTEAIAVYPQGIDKQWLGDPSAPPSINDTLFILELITHLQSRFCINPSLIYASGKSNGGGMVGQLACNPSASAVIAAFAPVSGAFYTDFQGPCFPSRTPIPILEFHGGADTTIFYEGGEDGSDRGITVPIPDWLHNWTAWDGCAQTAANETAILVDKEGANNVNRTTWDCGGHAGIVSHYFSSYSKHVWPTSENAGYNATSVIMEFFGRHFLPTEVEADGKRWMVQKATT